jgi:hypothetical protein
VDSTKYRFPEYRQNQYDKMMRALEICRTPNYREDLAKLEELIHIKWTMNYATNPKKKGSLDSDLEEVRAWHKQNYSSTA